MKDKGLFILYGQDISNHIGLVFHGIFWSQDRKGSHILR